MTAFELFQTLTAKAKQAGTSVEGLRQVNCALTDLYLANPHIFHVVDVLGPVCLDIWRGIQANLSSIAKSHVAMALLAGCVHQLRQAAQPQQPDMQERCTCNVCQMLQIFLVHPDQTQTLILGGVKVKEAQHGIRQLRPYADGQGHAYAEQLQHGDSRQYRCTKESDADKLRGVEDTASLLAALHRVFSQARHD